VTPDDGRLAIGSGVVSGMAAQHHFGDGPITRWLEPWATAEILSEDAFGGAVVDCTTRPSEVAPYPWVNPVAGPFGIRGAEPGSTVAVHLVSLRPARSWGVSTVATGFGLLSGWRAEAAGIGDDAERWWIWEVDEDAGVLRAAMSAGQSLEIPLAPFHGIVALAPPHHERRLSVNQGSYGGNLDLGVLKAGTTLYLRSSTHGAHLYLGDGHYAQGDGELAGTAVEGALRTTIRTVAATGQLPIDAPCIETDDHIGVVGWGRPLEDAVRSASIGLVTWIAELSGLQPVEAEQLVSQVASIKLGNVVNPLYTTAALIPKRHVPGSSTILAGTHHSFRTAGP
jgi:amidase